MWKKRHYLLVGGRQLLAVAAPGRVELDQHVLAAQHELVERLGGDDSHGAAVVLGGVLRLDSLLQLASLPSNSQLSNPGCQTVVPSKPHRRQLTLKFFRKAARSPGAAFLAMYLSLPSWIT